MGEDCCGGGHCHDEENVSEHSHEHGQGVIALEQLAMTNNILVNSLIDILVEKKVLTEEEIEAKLKEHNVEGYSEDKAEYEEEVSDSKVSEEKS